MKLLKEPKFIVVDTPQGETAIVVEKVVKWTRSLYQTIVYTQDGTKIDCNIQFEEFSKIMSGVGLTSFVDRTK